MEYLEVERKIEEEKIKLGELNQVVRDLTETHFHALVRNRIDDLKILEERFRKKMAESKMIKESIKQLETLLAEIGKQTGIKNNFSRDDKPRNGSCQYASEATY